MRREESLKRKKKAIIVSSIVAGILIVLIAILTITFVNIRKNNNKQEDENKENEVIESVEENESDEKDSEEKAVKENEEENQVGKYNIIEDDIDYIDPAIGVDRKTRDKEKENIEKAVERVKKDWGNDSSVSIGYTGYKNENGIYYVEVRKNTILLKTYKVNIQNETFETEGGVGND